jgi:PAS domain S-box-containing protein
MKTPSPPMQWSLHRELTEAFALEHLGFSLFLLAAYVLAAKLGFQIVRLNPAAAILWAPTGIALTAFLLKGRWVWPVIFCGAFLFNLTCSNSAGLSLGFATGSTLEGLLGAYLVQNFADGTRAFTRPSTALRFILFAGFFATSISATIGVSLLCTVGVSGWSNFFSSWLTWWLANALSALVLTPFLVLLFDRTHQSLDFKELLEAGLLFFGLSLACLFNFGPSALSWTQGHGPVFLVAPFVLWAAIRFCPLEATGATLVITGFATWGSLHGFGPYANLRDAPLLLTAYLSVVASVTLVGSAHVIQQRADAEELLQLLSVQEQAKDSKIKELTEYLDSLRIVLHQRDTSGPAPEKAAGLMAPQSNLEVLWFLDAATEETLYVSPSYETVWGRPRAHLFDDPHAWLDAVHPEDKERTLPFFFQEYRGDKVEMLYRIRRPDGSIRWIHDRGFIVRDESGKPSRLLGLASDITERIQREGTVQIESQIKKNRA